MKVVDSTLTIRATGQSGVRVIARSGIRAITRLLAEEGCQVSTQSDRPFASTLDRNEQIRG